MSATISNFHHFTQASIETFNEEIQVGRLSPSMDKPAVTIHDNVFKIELRRQVIGDIWTNNGEYKARWLAKITYKYLKDGHADKVVYAISRSVCGGSMRRKAYDEIELFAIRNLSMKSVCNDANVYDYQYMKRLVQTAATLTQQGEKDLLGNVVRFVLNSAVEAKINKTMSDDTYYWLMAELNTVIAKCINRM